MIRALKLIDGSRWTQVTCSHCKTTGVFTLTKVKGKFVCDGCVEKLGVDP